MNVYHVDGTQVMKDGVVVSSCRSAKEAKRACDKMNVDSAVRSLAQNGETPLNDKHLACLMEIARLEHELGIQPIEIP